jgi:hypothetical protein
VIAASISRRIDHLHESVSGPNLEIKRQPVARFLRFRFDVLGATEMSKPTGWGREFDDPIELPGRTYTLVTLKDATDYIIALPKAEQSFWNGRPRSAA